MGFISTDEDAATIAAALAEALPDRGGHWEGQRNGVGRAEVGWALGRAEAGWALGRADEWEGQHDE
eukprot:1299491-Prymnesium_polylepis.1